MYHKLVSQNSGLKVECQVNEKKVARKDSRIQQLEKNLREAKSKYEKLLNQCANLTQAMDVMSKHGKGFGNGGGGSSSSGAAAHGHGQTCAFGAHKIVRPIKGGAGSSAASRGEGGSQYGNETTPQLISGSQIIQEGRHQA